MKKGTFSTTGCIFASVQPLLLVVPVPLFIAPVSGNPGSVAREPRRGGFVSGALDFADAHPSDRLLGEGNRNSQGDPFDEQIRKRPQIPCHA